VRPRTWVQDGDLVSTDSEAASDPQREPLHNYPALRQCIEKHDIRATASMRKGHHTLWLPVWMHDKVSTCLEITQSRPFSAHKLDVIQGFGSSGKREKCPGSHRACGPKRGATV
jgi:hypothetical protein